MHLRETSVEEQAAGISAARGSSALLDIRGLAVETAGRQLLAEIDLALAPGEVHALLGSNGAGKTTLARLLVGVEGYRAASGSVHFEGKNLLELRMHERARCGIGMAWQDPVCLEGMTVGDYLGCGLVRLPAAPCLARVGLDPGDYLARMLDRTLSGGERRRIELAALLSLAPKLAILDEPTAGIDLSSLPLVQAAVPALRDAGAAVLLITHEEAMARHADSASLIAGGRIVCQGDVNKVIDRYKQPAHHVGATLN